MTTKREVWAELGRRYGIPQKNTPEYALKKEKYLQALIELNISDEQPVRQQQSHCSCPCYCGGRGDQPPMNHTMGYSEQVPSSAPQPPVNRRPVPRTEPVQQYRPMPEQNFDSDEEELNDRRKGRRVRRIVSESESSSEDSDSEYERRQRKLKSKKAAEKKKPVVAPKKAQTKKKASTTKRK